MVKSGKYFVPPPKDGRDFKELFKFAVSAGAGLPADKDGNPIGAWKPKSLAQAISEIDPKGRGTDIRSVQHWFQDNSKGINAENINWLAQIFGCGDPESTTEWRVELSAANRRLAAKRKDGKSGNQSQKPAEDAALAETDEATDLVKKEIVTAADQNGATETRSNLARKSEALFRGRSSLNLPAAVWAGTCALGFMSYGMGTHSITYTPATGTAKQIGYFWAPSWTIEGLVLLPVFLIIVSGVLNTWKDERRVVLGTAKEGKNSWVARVESFSFAFWTILLVSVFLIFGLQWAATYLRAFVQGTADNLMVDWILVALVEPNSVSRNQAFAVSILAFMYSGMIYWFYFVGLLLVYIVSLDFCEVYSGSEGAPDSFELKKMHDAGTTIMHGAFRCTVLAILIAMCIKLNAVYLLSDARNIIAWIINDARYALGLSETENGWLSHNAVPYFTSFVLVFITGFVFLACLKQVRTVLEKRDIGSTNEIECDASQLDSQHASLNLLWSKMLGIVVFLAVTFLMIGWVPGFSIFLVISILIAAYSLFGRVLVQGEQG